MELKEKEKETLKEREKINTFRYVREEQVGEVIVRAPRGCVLSHSSLPTEPPSPREYE